MSSGCCGCACSFSVFASMVKSMSSASAVGCGASCVVSSFARASGARCNAVGAGMVAGCYVCSETGTGQSVEVSIFLVLVATVACESKELLVEILAMEIKFRKAEATKLEDKVKV